MHNVPNFAWSPDSSRIALIDITYDLTPGPGDPNAIGKAGTNVRSNETTKLVVVAMDGAFRSYPLPNSMNAAKASIRWKDSAHVDVTIDGATTTYAVK